MITVTCDKCGEKLNKMTNQVELSIEYEGLLALNRACFRDTHKQLCVSCATRLVNWIDNQLEKGDDMIGKD